jgi:ribosomal-protein-alanine N-acetyltransferase
MIATERLSLEPAPVEFIEALERADRAEAQRLMNLIITGDWFEGSQGWMRLRIRQLKEAPALDRWLLHAMVLARDDGGDLPRTMVGHCGYHGAPDKSGMVEIGYRVAPPYQRRGYAIEAVRGLIDNAFGHPEVTRVRASIRPDNEPSLLLAAKLGFVRVGEQMDEVDGLEYVFDLERPG